MTLHWLVRPNTYHDSVKLMRISDALSQEPGVLRAAAVMATPLNLELLAADGLLPSGIRADADDLLVAVLGESSAAAVQAVAQLDELLRPQDMVDRQASAAPHLLEHVPGANLAVIAVPGSYAAAEAFAALRSDMHVFLFSDNVPLQAEVELKRLAAERDLLMMGPDCGTAIISGIGLGFANRVQAGPVGIVGASGTGIQQLCSLLDLAGVGIAQAIGTGGRDLSAAVGGSMTRRALELLDADNQIEVIVVISKPADAGTARGLHQDLLELSKPVIVCLLDKQEIDEGRVRYARTLTDAAHMVVELTHPSPPSVVAPFPSPVVAPFMGASQAPEDKVGSEAAHAPMKGATIAQEGAMTTRAGARAKPVKDVYGLFAGGTLCSEAGQILEAMAVPHTLIDLGADEYTRGRAHPIIDPRLRNSMLADLGGREGIGVILLDVILGDLAHPDPAGDLIPAIETMRQRTVHPPAVIAVLVGTRFDPQGLERQRALLEQAGVKVFASNAEAAMAAGSLAGGLA